MISYQTQGVEARRSMVPPEEQGPASRWRNQIEAHPLFAVLDPVDMDHLYLRSKSLVLRPKQLLVRQDEPASRFFFVLEGNVKIFRLTADGTEKILGAVGPGSCLGEACLFKQDARYAAYAESLELCKLLALPSQHYRDLILGRPDYSRQVLAYLAQALHNKLQDLEVLTTQNATERVLSYLRQLLPSNVSAGNAKSAVIELPMPKAMLASRLAMQPETLSRVLGALKRQGILRVDKRRLLIDQVAALAPEPFCA